MKKYLILLIFAGIISCTKDNDPNITPSDYDHQAKIQLTLFMNDYYFWYEQLPEVDINDFETPYELMDGLRYDEYDRWSYVTTTAEHDAYYKEGEYTGFGFGQMLDDDNHFKITYVYNTSPLKAEGVQRGWTLSKINGTEVSIDNYNSLMGPDEIGYSAEFTFLDKNNEEHKFSAAKTTITIDPIIHTSIIETSAGKTGYIVFNNFIEPAINALDTTFQNFANENVENCIVDFRYNGGGRMDIAIQLSSLLVGADNWNKVFLNLITNGKPRNNGGTYYFEPQQVNHAFKNVLFITSGNTASASEAVINGLEPYRDVQIIGTETHGKPVGMYSGTYSSYVFVPICFQLTNSVGFGDYFDGIPVDSEEADDVLHLLGDSNEACLKQAINFIETGSYLPAQKSISGQQILYRKGLKAEIGAF